MIQHLQEQVAILKLHGIERSTDKKIKKNSPIKSKINSSTVYIKTKMKFNIK